MSFSMSLMEIFLREKGFYNMILRGHDKNTTRCISETCKTFHKIVKKDMKRHYSDLSCIVIPRLFDNIVRMKMNIIYFTREDDEILDECDMILVKISKEITKQNKEEILKRMIENYDKYLIKAVIGRGYEKIINRYITLEYENFTRTIL